MLGDLSLAETIYLACGYTDMRKSIDGLAAIVQQNFRLDPFSNSLFLFCGHKRNRMKALFWEGNGFVLLYKLWRMGTSNGQEPRRMYAGYPLKSCAGCWKDCPLISQRR